MDTPSNILPFPNKEIVSNRDALELWFQQNQNILEILLDAYVIVDTSNSVVEFNVAFTEICGETYRKIKKIGNFCELLKTEFCPHACPGTKALASQSALRLDEIKASSKSFPHLQLIFGGIPILGGGGNVIGALLTIRDVSAETELQKKYSERKFESITDGLTQVYNKSYSETSLYRMIKSSMRNRPGLSVILCDIDHFKRVNDTHGHQAGDAVLTTVAQLLKEQARDTDVVGRFGGEEFITILPNCDQQGAQIFAERFRAKIAATNFTYQDKLIPITMSVGTSTFMRTYEPGLNSDNFVTDLVKEADTALYYAKGHGRNQVSQFESMPKEKTASDPLPPPTLKKENRKSEMIDSGECG